jgi:hypothetical protein
MRGSAFARRLAHLVSPIIRTVVFDAAFQNTSLLLQGAVASGELGSGEWGVGGVHEEDDVGGVVRDHQVFLTQQRSTAPATAPHV